MTFSENQIAELIKPINPKAVATREQRGQTLSYIEAVDAVRHANTIFGYGNWGYEVIDGPKIVGSSGGESPRNVWQETVKLIITGAVPMYGVGASIQAGGSPEAMEMAIKAADTDALKRALKNYGSQFGLDLYDKEDVKYVVEDYEKYEQWEARQASKGKDTAPADSAPPAPSGEPTKPLAEQAEELGFRKVEPAKAVAVPDTSAGFDTPEFDSAEELVAWKSVRLWRDLNDEQRGLLCNMSKSGNPTTTKKAVLKLIEMSADEAAAYFKEHDITPSLAGTYIHVLMNIEEDEPGKLYRQVKLTDEHLAFYQKEMPGRTYIDLMYEAAEWAVDKLANDGNRKLTEQWLKDNPVYNDLPFE